MTDLWKIWDLVMSQRLSGSVDKRKFRVLLAAAEKPRVLQKAPGLILNVVTTILF